MFESTKFYYPMQILAEINRPRVHFHYEEIEWEHIICTCKWNTQNSMWTNLHTKVHTKNRNLVVVVTIHIFIIWILYCDCFCCCCCLIIIKTIPTEKSDSFTFNMFSFCGFKFKPLNVFENGVLKWMLKNKWIHLEYVTISTVDIDERVSKCCCDVKIVCFCCCCCYCRDLFLFCDTKEWNRLKCC